MRPPQESSSWMVCASLDGGLLHDSPQDAWFAQNLQKASSTW